MYKLRHWIGTPKLRVPKSSKLLSFPNTEIYSFELDANFLTFTCLENVNCKRNVNLATPAVLEVMNQFTPRPSVDTIRRTSVK